METRSILESAVRYLHAMHDIELSVGESNLADALYEKVVTLNDPQLVDYWDEFVLSMQPSVGVGQAIPEKVVEPNKTEGVTFYRGAAAESGSQAAVANSASSEKIYRGNKV